MSLVVVVVIGGHWPAEYLQQQYHVEPSAPQLRSFQVGKVSPLSRCSDGLGWLPPTALRGPHPGL
jgi:hypothetical protein